MTPARLTTVRLKPPASITVRRPPRTLLGIWFSTWSSPVPPTLWLKELGAQGRLVFCGLHSPRCLPAPTASHLTWALGERRCTQLTPQRAALPSRWAGERGLRMEGPDTPTLLCSKQAAGKFELGRGEPGWDKGVGIFFFYRMQMSKSCLWVGWELVWVHGQWVWRDLGDHLTWPLTLQRSSCLTVACEGSWSTPLTTSLGPHVMAEISISLVVPRSPTFSFFSH